MVRVQTEDDWDDTSCLVTSQSYISLSKLSIDGGITRSRSRAAPVGNGRSIPGSECCRAGAALGRHLHSELLIHKPPAGAYTVIGHSRPVRG